jgi:nucleoside-triphosphatase
MFLGQFKDLRAHVLAQSGVLAHEDLRGPIRVGKYGVDVDAIERLAIPAIRNAVLHNRLVVIDEIGRMETVSAAFRSAVVAALGSPCTVLAAIQLRSDPFADSIKARPDVHLFHLDTSNRDTVRAAIEEML